MTDPKQELNALADSTVARIRTVLPGAWAALIGQLVTWFVARGIITDEVARSYQGLVTIVTTTVITGVAVWLVYALARWVEAQANPFSRLVARLLLAVLRQPTYPPHTVVDADPTPAPSAPLSQSE